jgi:hypothetical protein
MRANIDESILELAANFILRHLLHSLFKVRVNGELLIGRGLEK